MTESPSPQDTPQQPAAPAYQAAAPVAPVAPAAQPGKTLGIVALVLAIVAAPIGLILGIVALVQSKKAGLKNGLALAAIIVGAIITVIWIVSIIMIMVAAATLGGTAMEAAQACVDGATSVEIAGQTLSCEDILAAAQQ